MAIRISVLILAFMVQITCPQVEKLSPSAVEEHVRDIAKELPADGMLRKSLLQGARGDGVHYCWMDEMRRQGIKRAVAWVEIHFDRKGRPKKSSLKRIEYFTQYEGGTAISDVNKLDAIGASGLDQALKPLALERAARGIWLDIPRPKPNPFVGGAQVEFLDDEWLPVTKAPLYGAGRAD